MAGTDPIEARQRRIADVFSDEYAFEVPHYQRPYAWEREQAEQLLDDLLDAMGRQGQERSYFLGSVVLVKAPGQADAKVLDGQQRLATISLLLAVLRDLGDKDKQAGRGRYLSQAADPDRGVVERPRLLLRERDRSFFRQHVQAEGGTRRLPKPAEGMPESQARVIGNITAFKKALSKLDEAMRDNLFRFVLTECYLVVIAVPTPQGARRIFTVLNSRGVDLSATDILKAAFLDRADPARQEEFARRWEEAEVAVGQTRFATLFSQIRATHTDKRLDRSLEDDFPKMVPSFLTPDAFMDMVLGPAVDLVSSLRSREAMRARHGARAARCLRSLARLDSEDWLPPILLGLSSGMRQDPAAWEAFIGKVERLAYCLVLTGVSAPERLKRWEVVMAHLRGLLRTTSALDLDMSEIRAFETALNGDIYRKRYCKAVMLRLDEAMSNVEVTYDEPTTIEHVLPQSVEAGSEWEKSFRDPVLRSKQAQQIANLVFLSGPVNSKSSNHPFDRKRQEYFSTEHGMSPYPLTVDLLNLQKWDEATHKLRQARLIDILRTTWDLKGEAAAAAPTSVPKRPRGRPRKVARDPAPLAAE